MSTRWAEFHDVIDVDIVDTWLATHGLEDLPPQELEFQGANPPCMVQIYQIFTFVGKTEGVLLFCDVA